MTLNMPSSERSSESVAAGPLAGGVDLSLRIEWGTCELDRAIQRA
jgi:hypothetical protein